MVRAVLNEVIHFSSDFFGYFPKIEDRDCKLQIDGNLLKHYTVCCPHTSATLRTQSSICSARNCDSHFFGKGKVEKDQTKDDIVRVIRSRRVFWWRTKAFNQIFRRSRVNFFSKVRIFPYFAEKGDENKCKHFGWIIFHSYFNGRQSSS